MQRLAQANRRRCNGLTLVELLVAMGIVGLLVAVLLPAVLWSRETSRRAQCLSNMRQIGIALNSYHALNGNLPPAMVWRPAGEPLGQNIAPIGAIDRIWMGVAPQQEPDRVFANWIVLLLPQLELSIEYDQFQRTLPVGHASHERVRSLELAVLKCPSDAYNVEDNHFQRSLPLKFTDRGYARGNYALNAGTSQRCLMGILEGRAIDSDCTDGIRVEGPSLLVSDSSAWGNGVAGINKSFRFSQITRGLSKMVAVEEIRAGANPADRRGVWALGFVGSSVTYDHGKYGSKRPNGGDDLIQGCFFAVAKEGIGQLETRGMSCGLKQRLDISERATARSMHSGGVNVLHLDGSVIFVADDVDETIWHDMHNRASSLDHD